MSTVLVKVASVLLSMWHTKAARHSLVALVVFVTLYMASQTTFHEIHDKLVEDFEDARDKEEREEDEMHVKEVVATPAMLFYLKLASDDDLKQELVERFVVWMKESVSAFENESALFREIDLDVLTAYRNRLAEQKARLPAFEKLQCEAFKHKQRFPTRMNVYHARPVMKRRGAPDSDRAFRKKLDVCYQVYAPSSDVVRDHEKRFYDALLQIAYDAKLIRNDDFEFDPSAFHTLDTRVKNNFVHKLMQLSEECHRHLTEIESTLALEKLLEKTRLLDYETDSVLIRPAQESPM